MNGHKPLRTSDSPGNWHVAIVGAGIMGTQVAWAALRAGQAVRLYDVSSRQLTAAAKKIAAWNTEPGESPENLGALDLCDHLEDAVGSAQLIVENVPEELSLKRNVHAQIEQLAKENAVRVSNASAILCSSISTALHRPEQMVNANFSHPRSGERLVEIMGNARTSEWTMTGVQNWVRSIGMIPIVTRKEVMGYLQNRIWRAIKREALLLLDGGFGTVDDIDRAFILSMGTERGPFALMDEVGLASVKRVEERYHEASGDERDRPARVLDKLIASGRLGADAGAGFYDYPRPRYEQAGWLEKGVQSDHAD